MVIGWPEIPFRKSAKLDVGNCCTEKPCGHHRAQRNEMRERNAGNENRLASKPLPAPARIALRYRNHSEIPASTVLVEIEFDSLLSCVPPVVL